MRNELVMPHVKEFRMGRAVTWLIVVLFPCAFGSADGAEPQRVPSNAATNGQLVLSRSQYLDRVKAVWIGQMIGQWTGLQFEHKVASVLEATPFRPLPGYAPIDDDYYYEMVAIRAAIQQRHLRDPESWDAQPGGSTRAPTGTYQWLCRGQRRSGLRCGDDQSGLR